MHEHAPIYLVLRLTLQQIRFLCLSIKTSGNFPKKKPYPYPYCYRFRTTYQPTTVCLPCCPVLPIPTRSGPWLISSTNHYQTPQRRVRLSHLISRGASWYQLPKGSCLRRGVQRRTSLLLHSRCDHSITPKTCMVLIHDQQPAQNAALRCAIALGIPSALPADGSPRSIEELVSSTGADKPLLSMY